jgi:serralysin
LGSARKAIGNGVDNRLTGNNADNTLKGGSGNDYLYGYNGDDTLSGDDDRDRLLGNDGDDVLSGGNDEDWLFGGDGADRLVGGFGSDWAVYSDLDRSIVVSLADPTKNTRHAAGDTYASIENLSGSSKGDTLEGDGYANVLEGGRGADLLTGRGGADAFRFGWWDGTRDTITDFVVGVDRIELDKDYFDDIDGNALTSLQFTRNTTGEATGESHRIIYNSDTGRLFYDPDGSGSAARSFFAVLTPGLALTHKDFRMIDEVEFWD